MRLPKRVFQANYQNFRFFSLANDSRYLQSRPLISSLKRQTAFSLNGIPSAFFMSSSQYLLPDPETLVWTPSDRFKETSTVAFFYHRTTLPLWTCSGLLRSAFEYRASKSSQAFASSAILFAITDLSRASPKGPELEELNIFIAFVIKMVVRIIIADLNDYAVRFREPLGKSNYIRLLSCSLIHGIIWRDE